MISVNPHKNHLGKYLWLFCIFKNAETEFGEMFKVILAEAEL